MVHFFPVLEMTEFLSIVDRYDILVDLTAASQNKERFPNRRLVQFYEDLGFGYGGNPNKGWVEMSRDRKSYDLNEGWFSDISDKVKGYFGASKEPDPMQHTTPSISDMMINLESELLQAIERRDGDRLTYREAIQIALTSDDGWYFRENMHAIRDLIINYMDELNFVVEPDGNEYVETDYFEDLSYERGPDGKLRRTNQ